VVRRLRLMVSGMLRQPSIRVPSRDAKESAFAARQCEVRGELTILKDGRRLATRARLQELRKRRSQPHVGGEPQFCQQRPEAVDEARAVSSIRCDRYRRASHRTEKGGSEKV